MNIIYDQRLTIIKVKYNIQTKIFIYLYFYMYITYRVILMLFSLWLFRFFHHHIVFRSCVPQTCCTHILYNVATPCTPLFSCIWSFMWRKWVFRSLFFFFLMKCICQLCGRVCVVDLLRMNKCTQYIKVALLRLYMPVCMYTSAHNAAINLNYVFVILFGQDMWNISHFYDLPSSKDCIPHSYIATVLLPGDIIRGVLGLVNYRKETGWLKQR